ncbi:hypothetical protein LCGC14_1881270 [marine sediment metagenome]|uniref:Uncharacterized protein n=1 Tax=marine sediment metagenome TaxID=412755 RepID=A0A0F9J0N8_9ZZZZ
MPNRDNSTKVTTVTPVVPTVTGNTWASVAIPSGTVYAHVSVETEDCRIVPTASASDPAATAGTLYKVGGVYLVNVGSYNDGAGQLHHRAPGGAGTITINWFGN